MLVVIEGQPPPVESDDDTVLATQALHNPDAFTLLYERYLNRVYRYLLSRVGDEQDAQDLTAQTFMAAWEGLRNYEGSGVFAAWLMGIARHKSADQFRRRQKIIPLDEHTPHPAPMPEEAAEQQLQLDAVLRALHTLSADRAEAVSLRIFAGLSAAQAGEIMGRSEAAVNMLVYRAIQDLRRLVVKEFE
jgi:RNA polymerase sigma-70 factor (ECF subfamily)